MNGYAVGTVVHCVAFSANGRLLASGHGDGKVSLWDANTGNLEERLDGHLGKVLTVAFSPDGSQLATAGTDRVIKLWDLSTWRERGSFRGHTDSVIGLAFSPNGRLLASTSADRSIRIWDATAPSENRILITESGTQFYNVVFNHEGRHVLVEGSEGTSEFEVPTRVQTFHRGGPRGQGRIHYNYDGSRYAGCSVFTQHGSAIFSTATGSQTVSLDTDWALGITFHPSDDRLATCNYDMGRNSQVRIWDSNTGRVIRTVAESTNGFATVQFSPDGSFLAAAEGNWNQNSWHFDSNSPSHVLVRVWNPSTGKLIHSFTGHKYCVWKLAFSNGGSLLASVSGLYKGGTPGEVKVWDLKNGKLRFDLPGQDNCVFSVAFSPDDLRLATGGGGAGSRQQPQTIRLWNLRDGTEVFTLKGHRGTIFDLAFGPDGNELLSASADGTVRLWEAGQQP